MTDPTAEPAIPAAVPTSSAAVPTSSASESTEPMELTEPAEPAEPMELTESAEPAEPMEPTESAEPTGRKARSGPVRALIDWSIVLAGALLLAWVIRAFVCGAFYIPSNSMEPLIAVGDHILVNKLSYTISEPDRGDVVVFRSTESAFDNAPLELVKRVIAVGGESVRYSSGILLIDGSPTTERYLKAGIRTHDFAEVLVPEGHIFVLGDNRPVSRDSRLFGTVPLENIVGRAVVTYWPPGSIGGL